MQGTRALLSLVLVCVSASAGVIVVDAGGGGDFVSIRDAVAAASDGDVILVKEGVYTQGPIPSEITISNLSVDVIAEAGATVLVQDRLFLLNQDPGKSVLVRGLTFDAATTVVSAFLALNGDGVLWIEDCDIQGTAPASPGLTLLKGGRASVMRSPASVPAAPAGVGFTVTVTDSDIFLFDSVMQGFAGFVSSEIPSPGGDGLDIVWGSAYASGCRSAGGQGSPGTNAFPFGCLPGGTGGDGVQLGFNPVLGQVLRYVDSTFTAGPGGPGVEPCFTEGVRGEDVNNLSGTVEEITGSAHTLAITSPVREGGVVTITVTGEPGEDAFFIFGDTHDPKYLKKHEASLLIGDPEPLVPFATIPPSGKVVLDVTIPHLGLAPPFDAATIYVQVGFTNALGETTTSGGSALVVLDDAIP